MSDKCFAAIDLGTNSCRLLICNEQGRELFNDARPVRMGEGMYKEQKFTPEAMERGIECFFEFRQIMDKHNIVDFRAIATAACRTAQNSEDFIKKVYDESRIPLEVIDPYEEARLNLKGSLVHVQGQTPYVVLYDLGGGSTEITLATNSKQPQILHTVSIPWGGRNSSEAFDLVEFQPENAAKLQREIKSYTDGFVRHSGLQNYHDEVCFVATSSMPLRLASMIGQFEDYDRQRADGRKMTRAELDEVIGKIMKMSRAEMADNPYIGDKRSTIFIAAGVIFKTIYDGLEAAELTASLKSAKDGIVAELIEKNSGAAQDHKLLQGRRPTAGR